MRESSRALTLTCLLACLLAACAAPAPAPGTPTPAPTATRMPVLPTVQLEPDWPTPWPVNCGPEGRQVAGTPRDIALTSPLGLRVNLMTDPGELDPQRVAAPWASTQFAHLVLIYEGLTRFDTHLHVAPGAARAWEYNADATVITFTLRAGSEYADGTVLNARRFEYALLRAIDPNTGGEFAPLLDVISGAREWRTADLAGMSVAELARLKAAVRIRALDTTGQACTGYEQANCSTLRIGLREPAPMFHAVVALPLAYPVKEENIAAGGDEWSMSSMYQIGNGPYILTTVEPHVRAFFVPSWHYSYWRGVGSYEIEYRYIDDWPLSLEAYKNNEFDVIPLRGTDVGPVMRDPVLRLQLVLYTGNVLTGDVPRAFAGHGPNAYLVQPWVRCTVPTWIDYGWPGMMDPVRVQIVWPEPAEGIP